MNFVELAKKRYSCRNYQDRKVEKEKLDKVLDVARIAPTGGNRQPQRLIVIQEKEGL
ncbi:TPA: nitroreductase family protein, partial [Clostridioides difficile]|nr:nitroreductase family protein [Clostridioides difficile]